MSISNVGVFFDNYEKACFALDEFVNDHEKDGEPYKVNRSAMWVETENRRVNFITVKGGRGIHRCAGLLFKCVFFDKKSYFSGETINFLLTRVME